MYGRRALRYRAARVYQPTAAVGDASVQDPDGADFDDAFLVRINARGLDVEGNPRCVLQRAALSVGGGAESEKGNERHKHRNVECTDLFHIVSVYHVTYAVNRCYERESYRYWL